MNDININENENIVPQLVVQRDDSDEKKKKIAKFIKDAVQSIIAAILVLLFMGACMITFINIRYGGIQGLFDEIQSKMCTPF